ncbi:MAG: DUF1080 domain-containing protein [Chloroflexi bacterium]|nr:DUF1080 domain-containing protein [Chloroflexota bacterium]
MNLLHELSCANCGAPIRVMAMRGSMVTCDICHASFRIPVTPTPEPDLGDLLLGADFRDPDIPGWVLLQRNQIEFRPGAPAELWATFPLSNRIHPLLRTPGPFDDFDISATIRFIKGSYEHVSAGFELRAGDEGDYVVRISAQGTYSIGWHTKTEWGGFIVNWTDHPSLRKRMGEPNRVRVIMRGDQVRLYLNGFLCASIHDSRFRAGFIRLVLSPSPTTELTAAFSDLQLREVK